MCFASKRGGPLPGGEGGEAAVSAAEPPGDGEEGALQQVAHERERQHADRGKLAERDHNVGPLLRRQATKQLPPHRRRELLKVRVPRGRKRLVGVRENLAREVAELVRLFARDAGGDWLEDRLDAPLHLVHGSLCEISEPVVLIAGRLAHRILKHLGRIPLRSRRAGAADQMRLRWVAASSRREREAVAGTERHQQEHLCDASGEHGHLY